MYWKRGIAVAAGIWLIAGCSLNRDKNPHNDVLVFGTSTKIALDVSATVQNASLPEFTLGYKRLEAVWMPLKPGGAVDPNPTENAREVVNALNTCISGLASAIADQAARGDYCL